MRRFSVRWTNFRSFRDTDWIGIRPITLLIGANNSGKTSFLAPLLLLKQTLIARNDSTALLSKGDLIDLGSYDDLVHRHNADASLGLGLQWHIHDPTIEDKLEPPGFYPPGMGEFTFHRGPDASSAWLERYMISDIYKRPLLDRARTKTGGYSLRRLPKTTPTSSSGAKAVWSAIKKDRPDHFFFTSSAITRVEVERSRHESEQSGGPRLLEPESDPRSLLYRAIVENTRMEVSEVLEELNYLGPLRERARRLYQLSGEMPPDVGTRGEFAPEILFRWRDQQTNMSQVESWLKLFGYSAKLELLPDGDYAFRLNLAQTGGSTGFVDMGFGMSQVLPLIVQGVKSRPFSMIVAEQPEIHLNPRLQSALADLFTEFVNKNIGVLIESHSEHLLLRLRRLVAEEKLKASDLAIYYVELQDGESHLRHVPVASNGHIEPDDWPSGFFGDSLSESLALAQAQTDRNTL